jgi:hypothetical protein
MTVILLLHVPCMVEQIALPCMVTTKKVRRGEEVEERW